MDGIRVDIKIGDLEVLRCPSLWVDSERNRALTRMGVVLPDPERELFKTVAPGLALEIRMGYRGEEPGVWKGTVSHTEEGGTKDQIMIGVVGLELPLVTTKVTEAWISESPESVAAWAISKAGMATGRVDSPGVILPRVSAGDLSVFDLVRGLQESCQRGFDLDMKGWALWVDEKGLVSWGDFDADGEVPAIESGGLLIQHVPSGAGFDRHVVESFLLPGLRHSMLFRLSDVYRGVSGTFRAERVRHEIGADKARTFVWYGGAS